VKTCFLIGHRDTPESVLSALRAAVERHISEYGVNAFVVGHYGDFDRFATAAVVAAKMKHPQITLTLLLPYHPTIRPIEISSAFDDSCYPPGMESVPPYAAIPRANRYAVEHADYLIAYACYSASNTCKIVDYAKSRGVLVENLADKTPR
jgi:hypothetical protein